MNAFSKKRLQTTRCRIQTWIVSLVAGWAMIANTADCAIANSDQQPNILLMVIDDLNDWVGCLGGHPQARTPNIDRLAGRGMLLRNAHCQAPVCQPSRCSWMVSRFPSSTGLYFLNPDLRASIQTRKSQSIPERFASEGYRVMGAGKLFHSRLNRVVFDQIGTYAKFQSVAMGFGPRPANKLNQPHGHPLWDWGAFPDQDQQMPDYQISRWAAEQLQQKHDQPFLLCVGFYRPHVPMYVPQKWFQQHPLDQIQTPLTTPDDLADISQYAIDLTSLKHVAPTHLWIQQANQWERAVQAYLASSTFVDNCVGRVLTALEKSPYLNNTIVVLMSDHGFHLGEKQRWAKRSLWEDSTRVPLIFAGPGIPSGFTTDQPVGLIDVYPTLLQLSSLTPDPEHQGHSLQPLWKEPDAVWEHVARTTFGPGNHAVRSRNFRFIQYRDGSRELYDHCQDPHEWTNLASDPQHNHVIVRLQKHLPDSTAPILGQNSTGHAAYAAAQSALEESVR